VEQNLEEQIRSSSAQISIGRLPRVRGDEVQLLQLFQNLISNAVKYAGNRPPQVEVTAEESPTHWILRVKDNGSGIEPEYQERIFDLFARGSSKPGGSGIGLAICKRIVERHGGEIHLESTPGVGTTFTFTLAKDIKALL
jgi:signal transduction histidine kinase